MLRGFRWVALGAVVATAALVGPSAALACDGGTSAASIYVECVPSASGKHHATTGKHSGKPAGSTSQSSTPPVTPSNPPPVTPPVKTHPTVRHNKTRTYVARVLRNPGLAERDTLKKPLLTAAPAGASSLGSAFDLGSGPTILLALLLGSVLAALGTGGVRSWRNRHHQ